MIKFTNNIKSRNVDHISKKKFQMWRKSARIKRSILQHDQEISKLPLNITYGICTILRIFWQLKDLDEGNEEMIIFSESRAALQAIQQSLTWQTHELHNGLRQINQQNKYCIIHWISAHVGIDMNEVTDVLAKGARHLN